MKKNIILLLTTFSLCSISQAKGLDVKPKPNLNSSSATTDRVDQFRNLSIKRFEEIINNECDKAFEFAKYSMKNWSEAKIGKKSKDEAKKYSEKLIQQISETILPFFLARNLLSIIGEAGSLVKISKL